MNIFQKNKDHKIAYIYSEVSIDDKKFLIPFDGNGIPMKYEKLKEITENLTAFLEKVDKESYEVFYNEEVENFKNETYFSFERINKKISKEKKEKELKYIKNFDFNISKPILKEEEIENILKDFHLYSSDFIDTSEIKYPIILNFYKDNILLKSMICFKNLIQTLSNVQKYCDYNNYSYHYIPEEYIKQVLEYIILFKNPTQTSSLYLKNYIVYCPLNILIKRLNKDGDYKFRKNTLLKILEKNKVEYFEKDGRIIVNVRLALQVIGDFLSGIKK